MKCVIMQPTYLPWAGYFNLIAQADTFVFLDDVQYERASWQNRNRVLASDGPHWITVPVIRGHLGQRICEVSVDDNQPWRKKHIRLLQQWYARKPFARDILEAVHPLLDSGISKLVDLNIALIKNLSDRLSLRPAFVRSSGLGVQGGRSERLVRICEMLDCNEYLSPVGSAQYLAEDRAFDRSSIQLSFQDFTPAQYMQGRNPGFISHLSIVDVYANLGPEGTARYVRETAGHNDSCNP